MRVLVAAMLSSDTGGRAEVQAGGSILAECLDDLDRQFPGMRFRVVDEQDRVRTHVRIFVDSDTARDNAMPLAPSSSVIQIVCAFSGG